MMTVLILLLSLIVALLTGALAVLVFLGLRYSQRTGEVGVPPFRRVIRLAQRVRALLKGAEVSLTPPSQRLLNLAHGHLVSQYMITLVRQGVAETFEREARPAAAVAEELELDPTTLAHMLRVLAAHGCFEIVEGTENMVRHNAVSALLRADHPQSIRPIVMVLAETYASTALMPQMSASGEPTFVQASGGVSFAEAVFEALEPNKQEGQSGEVMLRAAESTLFRLSEGGLLADYPWTDHKRIVDVSASHGRFLSALLSVHKTMVGVVWDAPESAEVTQAWWSRFREVAEERVRFSVGEDLEKLPQLRAGDALLAAFVLNTLDDEGALAFLQGLRRQIGALEVPLLIADVVLRERELEPTLLVMDAQARVMGRRHPRTRAGWNALLLAGGFSIAEVTPCRGYASLIEARPAQAVEFDRVGSSRSPKDVEPDAAQTKEESKPLLTPNAA